MLSHVYFNLGISIYSNPKYIGRMGCVWTCSSILPFISLTSSLKGKKRMYPENTKRKNLFQSEQFTRFCLAGLP